MVIFFLNEQHEINYKKVCEKWKIEISNESNTSKTRKYQTACYLLAVPLVFEKVKSKIESFTYPLDWVYIGRNEKKDIPYHLEGPMLELAKLILNIWSGHFVFDLFIIVTAFERDDHYLDVVNCSMDMYIGAYKSP